MNKTAEAVDQARNETQSLYKRIRESTATEHSAIRSDLQDAAAQAQRLASSLKTLAGDRRADEKNHLEHAALLLEQSAASVKTVATANSTDIRKANTAMLQRMRDALQDISHAVAAKRAATTKEHA
jgi:hypothetical protein